MLDRLTFNDVSFTDYQTFFSGSELFVTPEKDVTFYSIPGRSGDLSISNNRLNNVEISINCFIREDFKKNYTNLLNFLISQEGYGRLETSKEPDVFRLAQFVKSVSPNTGAFLKYGSFTLVFNCKPQKYLFSGEKEINVTSSKTIFNPTNFDSKPLIKVTGTGTITINGISMTLNTNNSITYIDCDIQDAYEGTINRNGNLTINNGFPVLKSGENSVRVSGCTIDIVPRWYRI